jgi:hypothetical protein
MARPQVLEELKGLGWVGPTSYTLPYLLELIERLKAGETPEAIEASRRKTSVKTEGNGRQSKGEWVECEDPDPESVAGPENTGEFEKDGVKYRWTIYTSTDDGSTTTVYERFVPTVKVPKGPKDKGTWEQCEAPTFEEPDVEGAIVDGEMMVGDVKYRRSTVVVESETGEPVGVSHIWERYIAYVKPAKEPKAKAKLAGQTADFDPRAMLKVFENSDMRIRTGGRDWTLLDADFLQEQLDAARGRGDASVLVNVDGSQEACDVVWLEALISVKRRLALREEVEQNGQNAEGGASTESSDEGDVCVEDEPTQATGEAGDEGSPAA